jgi:hypothetical protein
MPIAREWGLILLRSAGRARHPPRISISFRIAVQAGWETGRMRRRCRRCRGDSSTYSRAEGGSLQQRLMHGGMDFDPSARRHEATPRTRLRTGNLRRVLDPPVDRWRTCLPSTACLTKVRASIVGGPEAPRRGGPDDSARVSGSGLGEHGREWHRAAIKPEWDRWNQVTRIPEGRSAGVKDRWHRPSRWEFRAPAVPSGGHGGSRARPAAPKDPEGT